MAMIKVLSICFASLLCIGLASAGSHSERDALQRAVQSGAVLPLHEILEQVRARFGEDILGVEVEHEHGVWIYEFKLVSSAGRLLEVYVDASTGHVLEVENER